MRKITEQTKTAFDAGMNWKSGHTEVKAGLVNGESAAYLFLHGNHICARYGDGIIRFSLCGRPSATTRERLQAVGVYVNQRKGKHYCNDVELCPHTVYEIDAGKIAAIKQNNYLTS